MKYNPQIYRLAAEAIDDEYEYYCCPAIFMILGYKNTIEYQNLFAQYFKPKKGKNIKTWGWWGKPTIKTDEQRILALLFMELIVKDLNKENKL